MCLEKSFPDGIKEGFGRVIFVFLISRHEWQQYQEELFLQLLPTKLHRLLRCMKLGQPSRIC